MLIRWTHNDRVEEVSDLWGRYLVLCQVAKFEPDPPTISIDERLFAGEGKEVLFLPFCGEFGHLVMTHMRIVHFNQAARKIVCCKPGQEVLFPSATEFVTEWVDPIPDRAKIGTLRRLVPDWADLLSRFPSAIPVQAGRMSQDDEVVSIEPRQRIPLHPKLRGLRADVVIGTRRREFAPEKNWWGWYHVAEALDAQGFTLAVIGELDTSYPLPRQVCHSGDYDTDAAVELLQNCKVYLGTDSGSSHLAAAVGAKMIVMRSDLEKHRDLRFKMAEINSGNVVMLPPGSWDDNEAMIEEAVKVLRKEVAREPHTT